MEKKGEILNQLAIISDLLENANIETESKTIIFEVNKEEFDRLYKLIITKVKTEVKVVNKFSIKIGEINIIFNTNSV